MVKRWDRVEEVEPGDRRRRGGGGGLTGGGAHARAIEKRSRWQARQGDQQEREVGRRWALPWATTWQRSAGRQAGTAGPD